MTVASSSRAATLLRFRALYATLYAAFGTASPYLPAFLSSRGLQPDAIGLVLAAGTATRLIAGPVFGRMADRLHAPRAVLVGCTAMAALVAFGYLPVADLWLLLAVSVLHATVLAPIAPIADALTLRAATPPSGAGGFNYGWVRAGGSAAFIVGSLISGQLVKPIGINVVIWLNGGLLAAAASCAIAVPDLLRGGRNRDGVGTEAATRGFALLLKIPSFRRMLLVAAMVLGSHAMHDAFAVIRWADAGIGPGVISVLWSESVAAEVMVFLFLGPGLLARLGPAGAMVLAAAAGVLRWAVLAQAASVTAGALVEPLHGLTFALFHLACMRLIADVVPPTLAATAQAVYGTVAVGGASALLTLAAGPLYAQLGAAGFWVMVALCAAAVPVAWSLPREPVTIDPSLPPRPGCA